MARVWPLLAKVLQRARLLLAGDDRHVLDCIRVSGYSRSGRIDDQVIAGNRERRLII